MTFDAIKTAVKDRTNLTSTEADTRIGTNINQRYKRITATLNLQTTRRNTVQATVTAGVDTLAFSLEKIMNVMDRSTTPWRMLKEVTVDEIRVGSPNANSFATRYAILNNSYNSVTILMDCTPQNTNLFTLYAEGYTNLSTLSGSMVPAFPEDFHEILVFGALADEYTKMEKHKLAERHELMADRLLSDLRMFLLKSASKTMYQGQANDMIVASGGVSGAGGSSSGFDGSQSWTQTGLITFNRGGSLPPFAVAAGAGKVANLKVEMDFLVVQVFS